MSLHNLPGNARRLSLVDPLLQLKVTDNTSLTLISVTVHDASDPNTGTYQPNAANLWVTRAEFDKMVSSFTGTVKIPVTLTYDDQSTINNVRSFNYLSETIPFVAAAQTAA